MLSAMQVIFTVFKQSLVIGSRNFTLVYVFLLALLLFGQLLPVGSIPAWEWKWLLLALVMLLLFSAIWAGWLNMLKLACVRSMEQFKAAPMVKASPLEAFSLFRAFLPGIAYHFIPIALGILLHAALLLLAFWWLQPLWLENYPTLQKIMTMELQGQKAVIESLSIAQQIKLGELSLAMLLLFAFNLLFSLAFMLWPVFVVFYDDQPFKAYWRSLNQYIKDPLRMLALAGTYVGTGFALYLIAILTALSGIPWLFVTIQMLMLVALVQMMVTNFVYVFHTVGEPKARIEPAPSPKNSSDSNDPPEALP